MARVVAAIDGPPESTPAEALREAVKAALDQARIWPDQLGRCYSVAASGPRSTIAERYLARGRCLAHAITDAESTDEAPLILDLQPGGALLVSLGPAGDLVTRRWSDPIVAVRTLLGTRLVTSGDPALCGSAARIFSTAGALPPRSASRHTAALGAALFALVDHHLRCHPAAARRVSIERHCQ